MGGHGVFHAGGEGLGLLHGAFLEVKRGHVFEGGVGQPGLELGAAEVAPVELELGQRAVLLGEDARERGDNGLAGELHLDGHMIRLHDGDEAGVVAVVLGHVAEEVLALLAEQGLGGLLLADELGLGLDVVAFLDQIRQGHGAQDEGRGEGRVDQFPVINESLDDVHVIARRDRAHVGDGAGQGFLAAQLEADGGLVFHQPEPHGGLVRDAGAEQDVAVLAQGGKSGEFEFSFGVALGLVVLPELLELREAQRAGWNGVQVEDDGASRECVGLGPVAGVVVEEGEAVGFFDAAHRVKGLD